MAVTAGYDVGGAHLKVALAEDGRATAVRQIACPLWQGLDRLDAAFAEAGPLIARAERHAATMTGELCEIFPDRTTGVLNLVEPLVALLGSEVRIWMGPRGFGSASSARHDPSAVASTNFLASAELVARRLGDALLVDMGSTTTDIIPVVGGRASPRGLTDGERLATGELVYTGLTRTDVCTVAHDAPLQGHRQRLAAGRFATMADVHRIVGELPDERRSATRPPTTAARRSRIASRALPAASAAMAPTPEWATGARPPAISPSNRWRDLRGRDPSGARGDARCR